MKMEELLERTQQIGFGLGQQMAILSFLADMGELSEDLREKINNEEDVIQLDSWVKLAANVRSVEEFKENM